MFQQGQFRGFQDLFRMTQAKLLIYGLGFILAGFLTLAFPYLLIGVVVTILFLIGAALIYFSWKMSRIKGDDSETVIIEQRKDFFSF